MSVLSDLKVPGHALEAVYHLNEGDQHLQYEQRSVDASRAFADGLNKLQSEWFTARAKPTGEMGAFRAMLKEAIPFQGRHAICHSSQVRRFADFQPSIQNHKVLLDGGYRPGEPIAEQLRSEAEKDHARLRKAVADYMEQPDSAETLERVIGRVADLLYVVRSNIAHGEKTRYGPDQGKRVRDALVCRTTAPVQRLLAEHLLEHPAQRLVTYGSLSPGGTNHQVICNISGSWQDAKIRGSLTYSSHGLAEFEWNENLTDIESKLLTSQLLPENWSRIDEFEGNSYKRTLILARASGGICAANAYVRATDDA